MATRQRVSGDRVELLTLKSLVERVLVVEAEHHQRAELNLVTVAQAVLFNPAAIDEGPVGAVEVVNVDGVAGAEADARVLPRDASLVELDVAVGLPSQRDAIAVDAKHPARQAAAEQGHGWDAGTATAVGVGHAWIGRAAMVAKVVAQTGAPGWRRDAGRRSQRNPAAVEREGRPLAVRLGRPNPELLEAVGCSDRPRRRASGCVMRARDDHSQAARQWLDCRPWVGKSLGGRRCERRTEWSGVLPRRAWRLRVTLRRSQRPRP